MLSEAKRLAILLPIEYDHDLHALHVVPVEREPRSLLNVIVGPPGREVVDETYPAEPAKCTGDVCTKFGGGTSMKTIYPWSWHVVTDSHGVLTAIDIGATGGLAAGKRAARYRWSGRAFDGPEGSADLGFIRCDE